VFFLAGQKFGTRDAPAATWGANTVVPGIVADRYRAARIVAFSTGNVYPLVPVASGGARETDSVGPLGEYANSCLGRERVLEYYSERHETRTAIIRLNYAIALRYGVLTDIALRVHRGETVDLRMGFANVIWQGDANRAAIECLPLAAVPPFIINITGPETVSVRSVAERFGELFSRAPVFEGVEAPDALLSSTERAARVLAPARMPLEWMIRATAEWVRSGRLLLGKPTSFERRDGSF
jgi:nucleoside-diphosphate-sugar epimerase